MALTHYGTLGVDRTATPAEIKTAYRAKASEHHPDRGGDHETMAALTVAYDTLGDEDRREAYDEMLNMLGTACGTCNGEGRRWKQKGFSARTAVSCKSCGGEGFTAVKAIKVNVVNMGGSTVKKRRVK